MSNETLSPNPGQDENLRLLSEALARFSHEIKTPLVSIKGYAELLLDQNIQPLEPTIRDWVRRIAAAANRLDALVRKVTDEERSGGDWSYQAVPVPVSDWLARCATEAESLARARRLRWECEAGDDLPPVALDPEAGRTMLLELLQNAARATPDGGSVRLTAEACARDGVPGVRVTVADSGVGVPAGEGAEPLFERFVVLGDLRAHHSGDFDFGASGLGVGLPLVRRIARAHRGEVWAEGRGRDPMGLPGARLHLWLPSCRPDLAAPRLLPSGRLLVVDADDESRKILAAALAADYEVAAARTADEALALWLEGSWDACIFDTRLPDVGGVELVRRLRAAPGRAGAALLAYTSESGRGSGEALRAAGADACLTKPVRARVLLQRLNRIRVRRAEA